MVRYHVVYKYLDDIKDCGIIIAKNPKDAMNKVASAKGFHINYLNAKRVDSTKTTPVSTKKSGLKLSIPKTPDKSKVKFDPLKIECPPTDNIAFAEFAMVGTAPTTAEVATEKCFTGQAGGQLNRICSAVRIPRYNIYLTYACKAELPKNNINKLWTTKGYRHPYWGKLQTQLIDELSKFKGKIIMLLGETAMRLLIDTPKFNSITKYRGSFYKAEEFPHLAKKLKGKIIGISYDPKFTLPFGAPVHFYTMIMDFKKMLSINEDPELLNENIQIIIEPSFQAVMQFYEQVKQSKYVAYDIESTPEFITCFSLAISTKDKIISMSIPVMNNKGNYWTLEDEVRIWQGLADILQSPSTYIICQNGMFDIMFTLRTMNIITDNFYFDTMLAQHICYTDLPKGLDYLTSAYTYFPYYKDEGKQSHLSVIKDWKMYWQYNAKDSAYLLPITEKLIEELTEFEALDAMEYTMELHKPLMEMEFNGILTDQVGIKKQRKVLERKINALQHGLNKLADKELNYNSSKQMIAYFYGICMIKPYVKKVKNKNGHVEYRPTCDSVALHRIAKKNVKGSVEAKLIIKMRKYKKLLSTYFMINVDADNRLRCSHKIAGTSSGRIATEKTFFGTGANLQNQPYVFKYYLLADKNYILFEVDLAKAEAHIVAYLTGDENMIHAFESGVDVHSFNASKIFDVSIEEIIEENKHKKADGTKTMRDLGKRVVHASNYKMGPQTFSDQLATEEVFMSQSECKRLLTNYTDRFPGLPRWHARIEDEVKSTRVLYNLFNRPKRFLGIMNRALYGNAYSYIPQSTVAELLNRGTIKIANDLRLGRNNYNIDLLTTVHDSDVGQLPIMHKDNLLQVLLIIKEHLTHTFTYKGKSFTIGLDAKIGTAWAGNTAEISKFTQEEVDKALAKIGL